MFNTLSQFEQILTIDIKQFLIERPLTKGDCEFLLKVGITARPKQLMLRVASAKKDLIHEYGILLKLLSGKKQKNSFRIDSINCILIKPGTQTYRAPLSLSYVSQCSFPVLKAIESKFFYKLVISICASLLRTISTSSARAHGRVHVQNARDFPQTKLDSEINYPFLLNEHGDPRFFFHVFAKNSLIRNIFEEEKTFDSRT